MKARHVRSRNRTLELSESEKNWFRRKLLRLSCPISLSDILDATICQNLFEIIDFLPDEFADLIFIDPPYNLCKDFGTIKFKAGDPSRYQAYLESWLPKVVSKLKPTGSLYLCGDWKSAGPIQYVLERLMIVRNRITFEREKGRGAKANWKNVAEDIWFATKSDDYYFNVEAVKIKRRVVAPYTCNGVPKDWTREKNGNFRLTYPSNFWTDVTIPFWSMPENTEHPTQKPEKLLAKILLASSKEGDVVFDPFLGSGTTSVVAKKLNRRYVGVEIDEKYAMLAEKRLFLAETDPKIQGY
ncbi:MAG: site-specific DNA-methyltransferase [Bacteroidia bacterium]|nr:site-specific DNA-methyltransferase [Bacteroidia bacterium]